jgi:hypothetical protein
MSQKLLTSTLVSSLVAAAGCFSDPATVDDTAAETSGGGSNDSATSTTGADVDTSAGEGHDTGPSSESETGTSSESSTSFDPSTTTSGDETSDPEPLGHVVFVTSERYRGNLMGLTGADAQCEFLASLAGLGQGRAWVALLSDADSHVNTRVTIEGPVRNVEGDLVAPNAVSFWNEDLGTQLLTEYGDLPETWDRDQEWSVTWAATPAFSCHDWQNGTVSARGDIAVTLPGLWIFGGGADRTCSNDLPFLCISQ